MGDELRALADRLDTSAAVLALAGPRVASVLFGATTPDQVEENANAVELLDRLTPGDLDALRGLA